jgi:hypothetical protein
MKEIDCMLKLAEDADWKSQDRTVELSVVSGKGRHQGTWRIIRDARDPRISVGTTDGRWINHSLSDTDWTMTFIPSSDTIVLFELFNVGSDPLENIGCGKSRGGDGWRQGPPNADINYTLSFGCI